RATATVALTSKARPRATHGYANNRARPPTTATSSPAEAIQLLSGSGDVLITARDPALSTWLPRATAAPVNMAPVPRSPSGDRVAAARKAPAGTRASVLSRSHAESTPGILSAKNSIAARGPHTPITQGEAVGSSACGRSSQPRYPAMPTPNTVR